MFTPQEIQEQTFSKAVFGGYDMQQVDAFLEPLTDDYIALYKENDTLRAKLRVLVEKFEELRQQQSGAQQALAAAQQKCDQMVAEAERKCAAMLQNAEQSSLDGHIAEEQERLRCARQTALNFIDVIEQDIRGHLDLLETLKNRDLRQEAAAEQPKAEMPAHEKPYDWQAHEPAAPAAPAESAQEIASEISENLEKLVGPNDTKPAPAPAAPSHPESATIKFTDLKFGKNYDPTSGS